jgi:uncharacterized protein (UPF0276 family)
MSTPAISGTYPVEGAGLGLRRALLGPLRSRDPGPVDFMEVAPENWIGVGGSRGRQFREFTARVPFVCHGLSLSIGGPAPLDETFLRRVRQFLDRHQIRCYSEHLSYCTDDGHLYDLMPIPFTAEAVHYVAARVRRVQDLLERRIALENVSYYAAPGAELSELEFIRAVLDEADCDLLLDVNNIYVNSVNHRYDAVEFLRNLPGQRIGVWDLLDKAFDVFGVFPTLLERDFNIPGIDELMREVTMIKTLQNKHQSHDSRSQLKQA